MYSLRRPISHDHRLGGEHKQAFVIKRDGEPPIRTTNVLRTNRHGKKVVKLQSETNRSRRKTHFCRNSPVERKLPSEGKKSPTKILVLIFGNTMFPVVVLSCWCPSPFYKHLVSRPAPTRGSRRFPENLPDSLSTGLGALREREWLTQPLPTVCPSSLGTTNPTGATRRRRDTKTENGRTGLVSWGG